MSQKSVPPANSEQALLCALVGQAWELRGSPYLVDACRAIETWHDRRHLRRFERRQQGFADLIRLLDATDPDRITARTAA